MSRKPTTPVATLTDYLRALRTSRTDRARTVDHPLGY